MRIPVPRITALVLLALCPTWLLASPPQATVQAQGTVTVNGTRVDNTTSIFAGDKVQTSDSSIATISTQGTMVQLSPNSSAIFSDRALDLGCGSAQVTTSMGEVVRVAGVTVTPAAQGASKFLVSQGRDGLKVSSQEGSVVVDDGAKHMVPAGQSLSLERGRGACGPLAAAPQGSTKIYIPAIAGAAVSGIVAYCSVDWFCNETSPSKP